MAVGRPHFHPGPTLSDRPFSEEYPMNRGVIGTIIGVLVVIILVIVILRLT
jgi:hypothetical protein